MNSEDGRDNRNSPFCAGNEAPPEVPWTSPMLRMLDAETDDDKPFRQKPQTEYESFVQTARVWIEATIHPVIFEERFGTLDRDEVAEHMAHGAFEAASALVRNRPKRTLGEV